MNGGAASRRERLPSVQRRAAIVASATRVFARTGYLATTTSALARDADINETLLFRHFGSKQQLYLTCIDAAWNHVRAQCEFEFAAEPRPAEHWKLMGRTFLGIAQSTPEVTRLWLQALTDTTGVDAIEQQLATIMRDVHSFATQVIERSQRAGGVAPGRDPRAEAWIVISIGMLSTVGQRLGDLLHDDVPQVLASHRQWLSGVADDGAAPGDRSGTGRAPAL